MEDPNLLIAYLMLMIYCLLAIVYSLGRDDSEGDERSKRPERGKMLGEASGAHLTRAGLGPHAGLGIDPPASAGKSASGLSADAGDPFLSGALRAYETIVGAYAADQLDAVRGLVADDVLEGFGAVLAERRQAGERATLEIVAVKTVEIECVDIYAERMEVTVRFLTEQVTALFDAKGALVAGDPQEAVEMADLWRFVRRHDSTSPNWVLVATDGE